jgi:hypothetical protein
MPETYIARSTAIAARMLGGEMMIMSALDSTFFTLNEVATVIWQAADGNTPLSEICRAAQDSRHLSTSVTPIQPISHHPPLRIWHTETLEA